MRRLPRREVELLLRLCASPGETVPREQLLAEVWSRRMVNDEVLSRAIAELRQALGDDAREPEYIETIPKVGYRLVARVRTHEPGAGQGGDASLALELTTPRRRRASALVVGAGLVVLGSIGWWTMRAGDAQDPFRVENMLRAQPLTSDPGWELSPRFTPDGRSVLYSRAENPAGDSAAIWIRSLDGTVSEKLVDDGNANLCPTVSPDGARLAFLRYTSTACSLMERPLVGGEARELASCAGGMRGCPDWSPDGASLVYTAPAADAEHGRALVRVALATLARTPVTSDTPRDMVDFGARYSPDGRTMAFQRGSGWGGRYFVMPTAGGVPKPLGEPEMDYGLAWAPDGRRLLLATDAEGYRALVVQSAEGGPMQLLGARGARFPDVSRQGAMVWEHAEYDANLWLVELGDPAGAPRQLTRAQRYDAQPDVSPDGNRVAFLSNRDGVERLYQLDLRSGEERAVPATMGGRWSQVAWSPDGAALTAIGYEGKVSRGCVHLLASAHTECPDALRGVESVRLEADGTFLALRGDDARRDLVRIDAKVGTETLVSANVERFVRSGARLVLQRRGVAGLTVQAPDREYAIATEFGLLGRGFWNASASAVWVASDSASSLQGNGIYRIRFDDAKPERVSAELPDAVGPALSIAPDERSLVLAKTDRLDVDLHWVPPP